jgi:hypothetical protein
MKIFFKKYFVFLLLLPLVIFTFHIFRVEGSIGVEYEEDIELGLSGFPPDFYISAGSEAESVEYDDNTLRVVGIPQGGYFALKNDEFDVLKVSPQNGIADLNFSSDNISGAGYTYGWGVITTSEVSYEVGVYNDSAPYNIELDGIEIGSSPVYSSSGPSPVISFNNTGGGGYTIYHLGLVEFEEDTAFALDSWGFFSSRPERYVAAGSRAESVEYIGDTMNVVGVQPGSTFLLKTDDFTILDMTTSGSTADLTFIGADTTFDGNIQRFVVDTEGSVSYKVGVPESTFYRVFLDDVELEESPFFSGEGKEISFDSTGSGEFVVEIPELVEFEEDTIFALENISAVGPTYYIAAGSKVESIEYIGDTMNIVGIYAGNFFVIKTDTHIVLEIVPIDGTTDVTFLGADITFDGHIQEFFITTTGDVEYRAGTLLANMPHIVTFEGVAIDGVPFDSGEESMISFSTNGEGVVVIENFGGIIYEEDIELELNDLN